MFPALLAIYLLPMAGVQVADVSSGLAKCAAVTDSLQRLQCYDNLAKLAKSGKPGTTPSDASSDSTGSSGAWKVRVDKNPVDDSRTVILATLDGDSKAFLILRCKQSETEVFINWNDYLGSDSIAVLTRFGDAQAKTKKWSISTDKKATFYPGDDKEFIRELLSVPRLVAQTQPYNESLVTRVFDVSGLVEAMEEGGFTQTCSLQ